MRNRIGILLWSIGCLIYTLILLAACVYAFGAIFWMHAPVFAVLGLVVTIAFLPLALAWLCRRIGKYLQQDSHASLASLTRRSLFACTGIAIVIACATTVYTGFTAYQCGLDRSRNAAVHALETRRNGFERVCAGDLGRFDISFQPIESLIRKLAFQPVDLRHGPFAQLESLGGRIEYMSDVPSMLYRGFRLPDGHTLTLQEHDMSADGSSSWRSPKDEPERINGLPARLSVMEAPSGAAVSHLSWVQGRRAYQLWVNANVVRLPLRERLFSLAASLPNAVPACPKEPPPRQWQFDENGRRIEAPPPATLTQAQVDAMFAPRPCK